MSILYGKRGTWVNQFAQPTLEEFDAGMRPMEYVVLKWGLNGAGIGGPNSGVYERQAASLGKDWLAERMAESGEGSQDGPRHAALYAEQLANQANQPGCVGAVINLEEGDGGWHLDNGDGTRLLINTFRTKAPGKPLFASLDTRGNRPNLPYQRICAGLCDGVMPMVYHAAFQQSPATAFAVAITPLMRERWAGKDIIATYQTYDVRKELPIQTDVMAQVAELRSLYARGIIHGANSYTMGHATPAQWAASLAFEPKPHVITSPKPDVAAALAEIRKLWLEGTHQVEQKGTIQELAAWSRFWEKLAGVHRAEPGVA